MRSQNAMPDPNRSFEGLIPRCFYEVLVLSLVLILFIGAYGRPYDEFTLPDPPEYSRNPRSTELENLLDFKIKWLRAKRDAEDSWIERLKRRKAIPDVDKEQIDKEIRKFQDDVRKDQSEINDLFAADAFDVKKNRAKAKANAKLLKDNIKILIDRIEAAAKIESNSASDPKKTANEKERDAKAAIDHGREAQDLTHDLEKAEKDNSPLFG